MERLLFLLLAICITNGQQQNIVLPMNPDLIYFSDNRPTASPRNAFQNTPPPVEIIPTVTTPENKNGVELFDEKLQVKLENSAAVLTNFSLSLMKYVNEQRSGNSVVSPYSIATLLALLQQGATATALEQITNALQMKQRESVATFKMNIDDINSRSSRNVLRAANNIFLANGFSVNPEFRAVAQRDFKCDVTPTSFASSEQVARDINNWIAFLTNNKITNLVSPDSLGINTQMVLVNAMYFKGFWEMPFRRQATKPGTFKLSDGKMKQVQYMTTRRYYKTSRDVNTDSRVIILPFERDEYSLMIIMPSTLLTVHDTMLSLTVAQLEQYMNSRPADVHLEIPKFSIRSDMDMKGVLNRMGITKIFEQRSDLNNIGTFQTIIPQVSSAVHSAVLSIDEEGGSAAAATAFAVVALSNDEPSVTFKVNRPFIAILYDNKTKTPLFLANIEDPAL